MRTLPLVVLFFAGTLRAQSVDLPIQNIPQDTPVWCWAAVAQQIIAYVNNGRTPTQCTLVATALGGSPQVCCSGNPACVVTGSWNQIQGLILAYGGKLSAQAPPTSPQTLFETLRQRKPIILHVRTGPMNSHVVVLRGMSWINGVPMLHINDPMAYFTQPVPYAVLLNSWIDAVVIQPKYEEQPDPSCQNECSDEKNKCYEHVVTPGECLDNKIESCMQSCQNDYGHTHFSCRMNFCNPSVGVNPAWKEHCKEDYESKNLSCKEDFESCVELCE